MQHAITATRRVTERTYHSRKYTTFRVWKLPICPEMKVHITIVRIMVACTYFIWNSWISRWSLMEHFQGIVSSSMFQSALHPGLHVGLHSISKLMQVLLLMWCPLKHSKWYSLNRYHHYQTHISWVTDTALWNPLGNVMYSLPIITRDSDDCPILLLSQEALHCYCVKHQQSWLLCSCCQLKSSNYEENFRNFMEIHGQFHTDPHWNIPQREGQNWKIPTHIPSQTKFWRNMLMPFKV